MIITRRIFKISTIDTLIRDNRTDFICIGVHKLCSMYEIKSY